MGFLNVGAGRGYLWKGLGDALENMYKNQLEQDLLNKRYDIENKLIQSRANAQSDLIQQKYQEMKDRDFTLNKYRMQINDMLAKLKGRALDNETFRVVSNYKNELEKQRESYLSNPLLQSTDSNYNAKLSDMNDEIDRVNGILNQSSIYNNSKVGTQANNNTNKTNVNAPTTKTGGGYDKLASILQGISQKPQ